MPDDEKIAYALIGLFGLIWLAILGVIMCLLAIGLRVVLNVWGVI